MAKLDTLHLEVNVERMMSWRERVAIALILWVAETLLDGEPLYTQHVRHELRTIKTTISLGQKYGQKSEAFTV